MKIFWITLLILISLTHQQNVQNHKVIDLDLPYKQSLTSQSGFTATYQINIAQDKVKAIQIKQWYLFIQVQPVQQLAWESTHIKLFSSDNETNLMPLKQCWNREGVASCFVASNSFNYKKSKIHAQVICKQACQYNISAQVSSVFPLIPNQKLDLDFEGTAYTKLFSLDTNSFDVFKRLQIILKPIGFLSFNEPIRLYVNKGQTVPTLEKHDYSGIHLWDDGKGVFIDYPMALNKFTILVEGPEKNVLSLQTKIITQTTVIEALQNEPEFSYIESQTVNTYKIKVDKKAKNCIKLTTISGAVQLYRILDQNKVQIKQEFTALSRTYGQLQYKLSPQYFKKNSKFAINDYVLVQIKGQKQSTFVFQFYIDNEPISHLIPEVNKYAELTSSESDQYYIQLVQLKQNTTDMKGLTIIEVMTTTFSDSNLKVNFYICKRENASTCNLNTAQVSQVRQGKTLELKDLIEVKNITKDDSIQGVVYYGVQLNYSQFKTIKNDVLQLFLVVLVRNQALQETLYTLQYVQVGKTYYLKQKESKKDRISIDQFKYYRYVNTDPDVTSIKLHVVQISGQVIMQGYYQDHRVTDQLGKQIYEYHNTLQFTKTNLTEIYVQVQGVQNAYYSLYLQLIRKSQEKTKPSDNNGYNQLIILEDMQYEFLIKPKQKMIFQMHSKSRHYVLYLQALLPLDLCMTQNLQRPPFSPNCQVALTIAKKQDMAIQMDRGLIANMGVTNNNDKIVDFKLRISSQKKACQQKEMGRLYKYKPIIGQDNQTQTSVCARYNLNKIDSFEVIVELLNMKYQTTEITLKVNDKQVIQMLSPRRSIKKQQLQKACGDKIQTKCTLLVEVKSKQATEVDLIVQYNHGEIILVDGVAHPVRMTGDPSQSKNFVYTLYNKVNTTIMVENIDGYYKFYGKIVDKKAFETYKQYPSQKSKLFSSANPFYYSYQVYVLTEKQIKDVSCQECLLLISVYINQSYTVQEKQGRFMIQCTQEDRFLKQNQPVMGYLEAKSVAFYEYYNSHQGSIFININNQNKNCSIIYAKAGNQMRASGSDYDKISQQSSLIVDNSLVGAYSICVQAKSHCPYSIQVFSSNSKIAKLKKGIFTDITLKANEQVNYVYQNYSNKTFKIFALNILGQLLMQIKKIESNDLDKILVDLQKNNTITYDLVNMDFLRIDQGTKQFCVNCTYFINIVADKYTQSSIVIPTENIQVPIAKDSFIKDIVKVNQTSIFRIFTESLTQFEIYVQYGKINVTITQSSDSKVVLNKVYQSTKKPQFQKFQIQKDEYDFLRYCIVNITGIEESYYSFAIISSQDEQQRGNNVKPGIPEYFFLQKNSTKCFRGKLQDSSEQFIISFDTYSSQTVTMANITCKIDNKTVQLKQTMGLNQLILQIVNASQIGSKSYQLCLISEAQEATLTFIQSSRIIYLPESTSVYAHHPFNFTFGPRGKAILQVDQCKQRVKTLISSSFNYYGSLNTQISQIRKSNNIIQFQFYGPVYMHVQTTGARIRWRSKDINNDIGVGYDKFSSGRASAYKDSSKNELILKINPVKKIQEFNKLTTVLIKEIQYLIFFAKDENQLNAAMHCQEGDFISFSYKANSKNMDNTIEYKVSINALKEKFLAEKYFLAGVIANMNVEVNKIIQTYRFIFPFVDVQREVLLSQQQINNQTTSQQGFFSYFMSFLSIGTFVIVIAIALFFCYRSIVAKCLKKRRGRLSDQGSQGYKYTQFSSMN